MANPITNENPKTHTMIEMYKKLHRLIKGKKGESLMELRDSPFSLLPIIGRYVNQTCIGYTYQFSYIIQDNDEIRSI